jgi:hypothetical protein
VIEVTPRSAMAHCLRVASPSRMNAENIAATGRL